MNTSVAAENVSESIVSTSTALDATIVGAGVGDCPCILGASSGVVSSSAAAAVDVDIRGVVSSAGTRVGDAGRRAGDEVCPASERSAMMLGR